MSRRLHRGSVYGAFLASGMTGLIYEIVWAKYLVLFIGGTAVANTIVLATFMGGLALGNSLFGRLADRPRTNPLRLYAMLEVGIGLVCLLFPAVFGWLSRQYVAIAATAGPTSPFDPILKATLSAASLLVPCLFMGGTLPVLTKHVVRSLGSLGVGLGRLYFLNTAGAVVGCLLGGFYVVEHLGLELGMVATSLVNLTLGCLFYVLSRAGDRADEVWRTESTGAEAEPVGEERTYSPIEARTAFWAIGAAGALSMLYELAWFRLLVLSIGGTVYSFSTMLTGFVAGIAAGSYLAGRLMRRRRDALLMFAACELGISLVTLVPLPLYERLPFVFFRIGTHAAGHYPLYLAAAVGFAVLLMGIPALLMGAALPLANRVCVARLDTLGRNVGDVFSANTFGNVIGALVAGFVLLPTIGLERTLLLGAATSGVIGVVLLWASSRGNRDRGGRAVAPWRWRTALVVVGGLTAILALSSPLWDSRLIQAGLYRRVKQQSFASWDAFRAQRTRMQVIFERDGDDASILVEDRLDPESPGNFERSIRVNGKPDATAVADMSMQIFVAHVGMFLHPDPRRVMVIGLGCGATAAAVLRHPEVERVDVAEISPGMVEAARHFSEWNDDVLRNPRMSLAVADAREVLLRTKERYDVIVSEPTNIWVPGMSALFTQEFYQVVKSRLKPGGVFSQWLHLYGTNAKIVQSVATSLSHVFPYVSLWCQGDGDLVFLASDARPRLDPGRFRERLAKVNPTAGFRVRSAYLDLQTDPVLFLLNQAASGEAVRLRWPAGRPYLDLFPRMEFEAARSEFAGEIYPLFEKFDERWRPLGSEPLYVQEYLSQFPLDEPHRRLLAARLSWIPPYAFLNDSLALGDLRRRPAASEGLPSALSEELRRTVRRAKELDEELGRATEPAAELCKEYLVAQGELLGTAASVLDRPPTEDLERRVDGCIGAHPARGDEFNSTLIAILSASGATEQALGRLREFAASGRLARLPPANRATLLIQEGQLWLRRGDRGESVRALQQALEANPNQVEALHLLSALRALPRSD